jgi:predicted TIM-barrel enzyme
LGKIGKHGIRLVSRIPADADAADTLILCPFLSNLDPVTAMWLGPLAWHDCNGSLLQAIAATANGTKATVFAGVFCAEPFRSAEEILVPLQRAGVTGVVNLPSVSFLDGQVAGTLQALNLGIERELQFLEQARSGGFRIACCFRDATVAAALARLTAELVIRHAGPLSPLTNEAGQDGAPAFLSLSDLLTDFANRSRVIEPAP